MLKLLGYAIVQWFILLTNEFIARILNILFLLIILNFLRELSKKGQGQYIFSRQYLLIGAMMVENS